ncbi:putative isopenicillin n protein [Botrytis fragariae]|uniref:Putative isopenicillin n protein n=1 Tax=Botrytis fragariae TaxID=1964551 RepID=A0A8H6AJL3_9HELO|nr:putative isopenicillin n protein [Botrytis fragariae]KAF5868617.1 putative isopenicillin n protein [Botrytis fragariae]
MSFTNIPILDLSLARSPETKPEFLDQLRHALLEVGFLYLKNVGITQELIDNVIEEGVKFFDIPLEEKTRIQMVNAPSFLGYSPLSAEITAHAIDQREQIDLSTPHPIPTASDPLHYNLLAPNLWPSPTYLPNFRPVFESYIKQMGDVSIFFTSLIAEAIGLPSNAFERYFDTDQQHKLKVVKYPDLKELGLRPEQEGQGVGPHKDSMLTSYLLQVGDKRGLQVQNLKGEWIDCPPIEGTLVVAIGQGMEALTKGVCMSTTHRVLSPQYGGGPRYSVPFFQGVRGSTRFEELNEVGIGEVKEEVRQMRRKVLESVGGRLDDVEFTFRGGGKADTLGEATLRNRIKSHVDVGEKWYPEILADIRAEQEAERRHKGLPVTPPAET